MTEELSQDHQWVGIDVSKRTLDVYVRPTGLSVQVANSESGLMELLKTLVALRATTRLIVLEATRGYQVLAAQTLMADGWPTVVVNPRQVRDFARATGRLAKTDKIDAEVLAHFADAICPEVRAPSVAAHPSDPHQCPGRRSRDDGDSIASLPELGQISAKCLASLCGLAPFNRDSGQMAGQTDD